MTFGQRSQIAAAVERNVGFAHEHVERSSRDAPCEQRFEQGAFVHDRSARRVDEPAAIAHAGQAVRG